MKDLFKRERKILRPKWANELANGGDKKLNRRIVRKRLKRTVLLD
jgi:hypothetical protein